VLAESESLVSLVPTIICFSSSFCSIFLIMTALLLQMVTAGNDIFS